MPADPLAAPAGGRGPGRGGNGFTQGIDATAGANTVTLSSNTFEKQTASFAIRVAGSAAPTLTGNTVTATSSGSATLAAALRLVDTTSVVARGNSFTGNDVGVSIEGAGFGGRGGSTITRTRCVPPFVTSIRSGATFVPGFASATSTV